MTIELFFSNRLETLADHLGVSLQIEADQRIDIFKPSLVIVPNANLKKWLQMALAKNCGIVMNVDFEYLENGLWRLLNVLDKNPEKPDFLKIDILQIIVLHVLKNIEKSRGGFAPVLEYLRGSEGGRLPDYEKRIWQLAEKLAVLFQNYEFHRQEMIRKWLDPDYETWDNMEKCQRELYLETRRARKKLFEDQSRRFLSLLEYADEILSDLSGKTGPSKFFSRKVHIFGFSSISDFHLSLVRNLGPFYKIILYAVNPCREFWEDVKTPWEKNRNGRKKFKNNLTDENEPKDGGLFSPSPNPILSLWGRPGRESIRMLCELTGYDFDHQYILRKNDSSVLKKIQNRILTFSEDNYSQDRVPQDVSLQIYGCPGRLREVETVYNSILQNLENNSNLNMTDIAIQVPDISAYKPVIDAVFNRKPKAISYNLVDASAEIESIYGKGVLSLLELAAGRFSRSEVFNLLLNPCLIQKWELSSETIDVFAKWTESLHIFHTFDKDGKEKAGYPATDFFTWKQGLTRMKLSRVLADPREAAGNPKTFGSFLDLHFSDKIPFSDASASDDGLLETFCLLIGKLQEIRRLLNGGSRTVEEWKENFLFACDELFTIPSELNSEKSVQKALMESLGHLHWFDLLNRNSSQPEIELSLFKEFVKSGLREIWGGYGDYLTSGVTVSALLPMRPIPFSIVYVLGMEEGGFPGRPETSSLDLRLKKRKMGDVSVPERNCYLFLELLFSVRQKLYISYVAKDLQKDRQQQPCSVVNQLKRYVESEILPSGTPFEIVQIPLKGSSAKYLEPDVIKGFSDVLVNYSTADRLIHYRETGLWPVIFEKLSDKEKKGLAGLMPKTGTKYFGEKQRKFPREKITVRQLRRFLENPIRESIRRHLSIYDEREEVEDLIVLDDEPFYGRFPTDYRLKMEPLQMWLDHIFSGLHTRNWDIRLLELSRSVFEKFRKESLAPEGVFGDLYFEEILQEILSRGEILKSLLRCMVRDAEESYHCMAAGEWSDGLWISFPVDARTLKTQPLSMEILTKGPDKRSVMRPVQFHGSLPLLWKNQENAWESLILTGAKPPKNKKGKPVPGRHLLEPALTYILLRCIKDSCVFLRDSAITFHIAYKNGIQSWKFEIDPEEAETYIQKLTGNYLDPFSNSWIPYSETVDAIDDVQQLLDEDVSDKAELKFFANLVDAISRSNDSLIRLAKPEVPSDALQIARERFGVFFKNISVEESNL